MKVEFFVPGIPKPGGSKRGFVYKGVSKKTGQVVHRAAITEDCKTSKDWRAVVALRAYENFGCTNPPFLGPVGVVITFRMPRPKGHYGTGRKAGHLRATAPAYPTTKPDATKLWRSTEDALKGIAWRDDSQVVQQVIRKLFCYEEQPSGAEILIKDLLDA